MTRLDDIKARVAAAQAPDEEWVTEIAVQGHHIDLMEHARTDIPDLLRVVDMAEWFVSTATAARSLDWAAPEFVALRDALADLDR